MSVAHGEDPVVRFINARAAKVDVVDDKRFTGYAIVFNAWSQDLGGFKERIAPTAVDRTLRSGENVDALQDHRRETTTILGSTESGLLRLKKDRHGLGFELTPPDTQAARDLVTVVKSGLVKGMSFGFRAWPDGSEWEEDEDGRFLRTVTDMVFSEISVVVNPAYLQTTLAARNQAIDRAALEEHRSTVLWKPSLRFRERQFRAGIR